MEFRRLTDSDLTSLLELYIAFAKERNCYKVILQSGISRTDAHRFYEHKGFNGTSKRAFDMRLE